VAADLPLLGFIGRLVTQKGVDLILEVLPSLLQQGRVNLVCVGSGDAGFEQALRELAARFPEHAFVHIGYSEELAHQVEAGADIFLMPSRFEPCGLNQLYSLAYGTLPLVHHTGGLADTVVNASDENLAGKTATGFVFYDQSAHAMRSALEHALYVYSRPGLWQQMQRTAMEQSFSWAQSARAYADLYTKEH
jgi:starch synthase